MRVPDLSGHPVFDEANRLEPILLEDLPTGFIHGDIHEYNLLVDDDGQIAGLIDWEEATVDALALDLASAVRWLCVTNGQLRQAHVDALLVAYASVRPLPFPNLDTLTALVRYVALVVSIWVLHRCYIGDGDDSLLTIADLYWQDRISELSLVSSDSVAAG